MPTSNTSLPAGTGVWSVNRLCLLDRLLNGGEIDAVGPMAADPFQEGHGGVAFVDVPDRRFDREGFEGPDAADAEDHLLAKAHLPAPNIERVGDGSIRKVVFGYVGVEQDQRDPSDIELPYRRPDDPSRELDLDLELPAGRGRHRPDREAAHVQGGVDVLLLTAGLDFLAEVAPPETADRLLLAADRGRKPT